MSHFTILENSYIKNAFSSKRQSDYNLLNLYHAIDDLHELADDGRGLYHLAAKFLDYRSIAFLIEQGVSPSIDKDGNTPLHEVVKATDLHNLSQLPQKIDDFYQTTRLLLTLKIDPNTQNCDGVSAIYEGARRLIYPFIQALSDAKINLNVIGKEHNNLLHLVTCNTKQESNIEQRESAIKVIKILIDSGNFNLDEPDSLGMTALAYAQDNGIDEIITLLTPKNIVDDRMTLAHAVLSKNILVLAWFIANGHNLNEVFREHDKTALMLACEYPSLDSIYLLLKCGADINFKNSTKSTAVKWLITRALYNLNTHQTLIVKILQVFVNAGLNLNDHVDKIGNTAFNLLCQQHDLCGQNDKMVAELINAGCDINQANFDGVTPLMSHARYGDENRYMITELLLNRGADIDLLDNNGFTALMYCAMNKDKSSGFRIAKLILDYDRNNVNKINYQGENVLELAVKFENQALVEFILANWSF